MKTRIGSAGAPVAPAGLEPLHWERFKQGGDPGSRHWLIEHYAPLVAITRQRHFSNLPASFDRDDLDSVGRIRLIGAVDSFEPGPRRSFPPYAIRTIRWGMSDAVRRDNWVPNPRAEGGPKRSINFERLDDVHAPAINRGAGENETATLADIIPDHSLSVERSCFLQFARARLVQQLQRLPEKERTVLTGYYLDGMDLGEAARQLGRGKRRAYEAKTRAIGSLRRAVGEDQLLLSILEDRG